MIRRMPCSTDDAGSERQFTGCHILRRQILEAQEKLKTLTAAAERKAEQTRLSELHTKLAIEMEAFRKYG